MSNRQDTFNRSNDTSSPGSPSDGGSAWVVLGSGTYGILSNCGYKVAGTSARHACYLETSSVQGEAVWTQGIGVSGLSYPNVLARIVDNSNFIFVQCDTGGSSSSFRVFKLVAGTPTQLGSTSSSVTWAVGDTLSLSVDASHQWTAKHNGVTKVGPTGADSTHGSATKWGFSFYEPGTGFGLNQWDFTDTAGAVTALPIPMLFVRQAVNRAATY